MAAYYNEHDAYAAAWLRNLIAAGHIAPGDVDERDIRDVLPSDLDGYTQCHFFAGIGGWSLALRLAGWPDDRPVWTGSCPCQPFSAAGKGGGFADERHLWPHWHHLIRECGPGRVFGEQVADKAGLAWLDLVQADLEGEGYAVGAADLCAAGVEAPHKRQRLWFVADANAAGQRQQWSGRLLDGEWTAQWNDVDGRGSVRSLADSSSPRLEGGDARQVGRERPAAERSGETRLLQYAPSDRRVEWRPEPIGRGVVGRCSAGVLEHAPSEQVGVPGRPWFNGGAVDWIYCRDDKWRPVEPGTFPLAHGVSNRVGLLRGYGNAIVPQVAAVFIEACS